MSKVLIYEKLNDVKTLEKGRSEDGFMRLKGIFGECSTQKNRNGRIYIKENYRQMVDRIKERINSEGVPGQLEHPQTMNIDYNEVSHMIESIDIDDKGMVTGTIKLLNTPKGKIAQALVEGGLPLFISSRATGNVDKNGVVTLENIQTYDLVGTPGFANARLDLTESAFVKSILGDNLISESVDDNTFIIESKQEEVPAEETIEETVKEPQEETQEVENEKTNESEENSEKENKENYDMTEQEHKELLDKIALLENLVEKANKRIDDFNSQERMEALAEGIQNWIFNEYSPKLQEWIDEAMVESCDNLKTNLTEQFANGIQNWITEEFAPQVEGWLNEEYTNKLADGIQGWVSEEFANTLQNWITEEYTANVEKWITEDFRNDIMENLNNKMNESKEDKFASVDRILEMLDKNPAKPVVGRVNENANPNEPLYIREMPASVRPLYESANDNMKAFIDRKAHLYDLRNSESIERFWESIDWKKEVPAAPVYEGLDQYSDSYERNLRENLRKHRR